MKEQTRLQLSRITARYERQRIALGDAEREAEKEAAFFAEVSQIYASVLRPIIEEIGAELRLAGHDYRIEDAPAVDDDSSAARSPRLHLHLLVRGRTGSKDLIQFLVRNRGGGEGLELIAELVLKRSPVELAHYGTPSDLTADVAEHLLVEAIEQLLASPST